MATMLYIVKVGNSDLVHSLLATTHEELAFQLRDAVLAALDAMEGVTWGEREATFWRTFKATPTALRTTYIEALLDSIDAEIGLPALEAADVCFIELSTLL